VTRRERELTRDAGPLGWKLEGTTGGGHLRLRHPGSGLVYFTSATPSDWRARRKTLSDLRRMARGARGGGGT